MTTPTARRRWIWTLVWAMVAAVLVTRAVHRPPTRGVLLDHLEFGRRLAHGEDVYGPWRSDPDAPIRPLHAPYPPSFGLLTAPFHVVDATFGLPAARGAWALLQVASLLVCAWLLRHLRRGPPLPPRDDARWHWLWLAAFVLGARFLLRDTHGGGGNLINTALVLGAFAAHERERPRTAGALLALSLVTKPTMVWFVPVFAAFRAWRTLAWTAGVAVMALGLTLALQRGDVEPWWRWLRGSWALATQADAFAVPAEQFPPFEWMNQALRFAIARWCGTVPPEFAERVELGVPGGLGLATDTVAWLVRLVSAALLGAVLHAAWRARSRTARTFVVAATFALALLLSPLSWKGHHVALLPLLLLLVAQAHTTRSRVLLGVLVVWFVACALLGKDVGGDALDEWLNSVYAVTFGDVALLLAGLACARSATDEHGDAARRSTVAQ